METTRHYTATVYIVNDGATALHDHDRLGITIPPGGHVHRDELPHRAAIREVREETGFEAQIVTEDGEIEAEAGRELPQPRYQMLYDIDTFEGRVAHQHIDHVYFARVDGREIVPTEGEAGPDAWDWYTPADLRESSLDDDVVQIGTEAIETVSRGT